MSTKHILFVATLILCACGQRQDAPKTEAESVEYQPQRHVMEPYHLQDTIKGTPYTFIIHREAVDSLGIVTDEFGDEYVDNLYELSVSRAGTRYFQHTFGKRSFFSFLDEEFRDGAIFDGFRFDKLRDSKLYFSVCVSMPDSDLSRPFILCVGPDGSYTIEPDDVMDVIEEQMSDADNDGV